MSYKGNTTSLLVTIALLLLLLISGSTKMISIALLYTTMVAYGQASQMNFNPTNPIAPENIPLKKVHLGDIDITYSYNLHEISSQTY